MTRNARIQRIREKRRRRAEARVQQHAMDRLCRWWHRKGGFLEWVVAERRWITEEELFEHQCVGWFLGFSPDSGLTGPGPSVQ